MATRASGPELWRFCTVCDPQSERPFSVERAYIKHLSSQRHLRTTSQPLKAFDCPDCSKHFSRESEIHRHLTNGRCSGTPASRLITGPTTTSSKKHTLSISPNEVPWKIYRTAVYGTDATVGSPPLFDSRPIFGHKTDQVVQAHSRTKAQVFANRPLERMAEDVLPPRRTIAQVNKAVSLTALLLHNNRQHATAAALALSPDVSHESIDPDTQTSCLLTHTTEIEPQISGTCDAFCAVRNGPNLVIEDKSDRVRQRSRAMAFRRYEIRLFEGRRSCACASSLCDLKYTCRKLGFLGLTLPAPDAKSLDTEILVSKPAILKNCHQVVCTFG
jgi:hypothetical protein